MPVCLSVSLSHLASTQIDSPHGSIDAASVRFGPSVQGPNFVVSATEHTEQWHYSTSCVYLSVDHLFRYNISCVICYVAWLFDDSKWMGWTMHHDRIIIQETPSSKLRYFNTSLLTIFSQWNNWFCRSEQWCDWAFWAPSVNETSPILKSILKNRKIATSQRWIDRFWQNLAWWCASALQTLLANKISRFKMAAAAICKIKKFQYFHYGWTNFDKIWHGDVPRSSRHPPQIKLCAFKNLMWCQLPCGKSKKIMISLNHFHRFQHKYLVCWCILRSLSAIKCMVIDNKTANLKDRNCSLSTALTVDQWKLQKKH